ncbi:hypothetical protein RFI_24417 [Reticulomyxa filosa]|uniref:Uncharacterized protein n=1 Tax=Reticulomyxa filosa TaxID=46433 RepID=X6MGF5_RETFI|nr:hypothetical protein RFI_24417 [Reticulomyxa filosa]|eukprot:ETO12959.1 hypothetical protein RFI_24417 [Reticulomyxa filosa]
MIKKTNENKPMKSSPFELFKSALNCLGTSLFHVALTLQLITEEGEGKIYEKEEEKRIIKERRKLNRKQIWCLLAYMFLQQSMNQQINIGYHCKESNNCVFAYLLTLFHYLGYNNNNINWIHLYDHANNMLFDYNESQSIEFAVNFANSYAGFGIAGTQEEMILGSFTEACVIVALAPSPMKYRQIIVIQNMYVIAKFQNYGRNLKDVL